MNILPKKRWHVRTKENIARVRKDEAEAAEKERQEQERIANADREARLSLLKQKSTQKLLESGIVCSDSEIGNEISKLTEDGHVNLFNDLEHAVTATNKEHDLEKKQKQEEYEKKIGYLTYLGQDTNEDLKKKNWYEVPPECSRYGPTKDIKDSYDKLVLKDEDGKPKPIKEDVKDGEVAWKSKQKLDPLNMFKKHIPPIAQTKTVAEPNEKQKTELGNILKYNSMLGKKSHKHIKKKHKNDKDKGKDDNKAKLLKLREARLKREKEEQRRTELFLSGGLQQTKPVNEDTTHVNKRKYNSQFNPELARQNR